MKRAISILLVFAMLFLLVALLFASLQTILDDEDWFVQEYEELGQARYMGMSNEDLVASTMNMIRYMQGKIPSMDLDVTVHGERVSMFNDQERIHMADVRALYGGWCVFQIAAFVFAAVVILLSVLLLKKQALLPICRGFLWGSLILLVIVAVLGVWVAVDFDSFWTEFHHLFFTNDLWLFDPHTSRMINMMPEKLFYDITVLIALRFVLPWAVLTAGAFTGRHFLKKKAK